MGPTSAQASIRAWAAGGAKATECKNGKTDRTIPTSIQGRGAIRIRKNRSRASLIQRGGARSKTTALRCEPLGKLWKALLDETTIEIGIEGQCRIELPRNTNIDVSKIFNSILHYNLEEAKSS